MKMETRFTFHFVVRLTVLTAMIIGLLLFLYVLILKTKSPVPEGEQEIRVLKKVSASTLVAGDRADLPEDTENWIRKQSYSLQILNEQGKAIYSLHPLPHMPEQYSVEQLLKYKQDLGKKGISLYIWSKKVQQREWTWLLAKQQTGSPEFQLNQLMNRTQWKQNVPSVPEQELRKRAGENGWLLILDETGNKVLEYQTPAEMKSPVTIGELSHKIMHQNVVFAEKEHNGQKYTWVFHPDIHLQAERMENWAIAFTFYMVLIGSALLLIGAAYIFGRQFSSPIWTILNWIQKLSKGEYQLANEIKHTHQFKWKKGSFRLFKEVTDALLSLSSTLASVEDKRRKLDESREQWLAGVSHDLKNPISTIKGYADLYSSGGYQWTNEEIEEYLQLVIKRTSELNHLIEDLNLTFQLQNHALPVHLEPIHIQDLITSLIHEWKEKEIKENPLHFSDLLPASLIYPVDPHWFKRAVNNLLQNAVVHNPPRTTIRLILSSPGLSGGESGFTLTIQDEGTGMPKQMVENIFNPYYRNPQSKGSGLGMSIARQLIEVQGGKIEVTSELHQGTQVSVIFPGVPATFKQI
ncbi:sensor histidine kinase [Paenactinomyces guangxiensis]|uniref:histidine kinase n=1 Tax=Paenactinomyces guangxiensis TaxID=1490290 RepID=A0A7W2A8A3_9BACL|nr:HAMP domain-containing sensor histidine kinase [Paenactinomyces guangxiensis]MBA4495406.1 HAMP domain-containing histidine kinase [Paenactinomyces guangxiensis]MBH8592473.1 HAMP domain-containing histidine kinase [Paenactinomyces guangxiensis]